MILVLVAGCSSIGDDETVTSGTSEPVSTAVAVTGAEVTSGGYPLGLDAVAMPAEAIELLSVFEEMPDEFEGVARHPAEYGFGVGYGDVAFVAAARMGPEDLAANGGSIAEMMSLLDSSADAVVSASQLDPGAGLLWWFATVGDDEGFGFGDVALWAEPDGNHLFSVGAETPEMRDELVMAFVEAIAVEPSTMAERVASVSCEELYRWLWWPEGAFDEFGNPIEEFFPSPGAQALIDEAQLAALAIEDTEEAWHEAMIVTWRDVEPETFNATCDLFTDAQRRVLAALGGSALQWCSSAFTTDSNGADSAIQDLEIAEPPRDDHGYVDWTTWVAETPDDVIAVCRHLGY